MILASFFGLDDLVRLSLEEDAAKANLSDTQGRTPLPWAAERGHAGMVRLLLDYSVTVYSTDDRGRTPLSYATEYDNVKILRLLPEYSAKAETGSNEARAPPP